MTAQLIIKDKIAEDNNTTTVEYINIGDIMSSFTSQHLHQTHTPNKDEHD